MAGRIMTERDLSRLERAIESIHRALGALGNPSQTDMERKAYAHDHMMAAVHLLQEVRRGTR